MSRAREIADRDLAATELILDADNDTSITADTDDQIDFKIGGTDKMKLTSAGILDVTGSNSAAATSGTSQNGSLRLSQGGGNGVVDMGFDTTNTIGWIQATNKANLGTNYTLNLNPNSGDVKIGNGNLVIGTSGKGIDFSATSDGSGTDSSELLDDYEEGTFDATLGGHSNIGTAAAALQAGSGVGGTARYTKIGRIVHFSVYFFNETTSTQASGNLVMNGLPYANAGNSSIVSGTATYNVDISSENAPPIFQTSGSSLYGLTIRDNNTWADTSASILPNGTAIYFYITGTYEAT